MIRHRASIAWMVAMGVLCLISLSEASGLKNPKATNVRDEGTSQGDVKAFDFTGAGVTATVASGVATVNVTAGGGTPSAPTNSVQFNNASSFGGDSSFSWNPSANLLGISRDAGQTGLAIVISNESGVTLASVSHDGGATFNSVTLKNRLSVDSGGTGLTSGTSGGVLGFTGTSTIASSVALTANGVVIGGGAGATPTSTTADTATTGHFLASTATAPVFRQVVTADLSGTLAVANGGTNISSGSSGGIPYFNSTTSMASSAALTANAVIVGGGAATAPSTITADTTAGHALFSTTTSPAFKQIQSVDVGGVFDVVTKTNLKAGTLLTLNANGTLNAAVTSSDITGVLDIPTDTNFRVQDEGTVLTARPTINFTGAGVSCADGTGRTDCTISGAAGGHKVFMNFPVQSAKLSGDSAVRIDAGLNGGASPYTMWRLLFNDGTNIPGSNVALWQGRMDDNWDSSSLTAKIDYAMLSSDSTSTANGQITFGVSIWAITSGDAVTLVSESYDTENTKTQGVPTVMSRDQTVSIPLTTIDSLAPGDWFMVKLRRNGADSITGDAMVVSFAITQ